MRGRGLAEQEARILAGDAALFGLFAAATAGYAEVKTLAQFLVNDVQRERKERDLSDLPFGGQELGELAALADSGAITGAAAKKVLAVMLERGGRPEAIVEELGLRVVRDEGALAAMVDAVLADNPEQVAAYRAGKTALLGFFLGQVVKRSGGAADPQAVRKLLAERL